MNWLQKTARRTLYHGTCRFHEDSIREVGLVPQAGDFVSEAYESDYAEVGVSLPELIFATDKEQIDKAVTAMTNCIAKSLGKNYHDVTNDEIRAYGMIAVFKGEPGDGSPEETGWEYRERDDDYFDSEGRETVEPGDYFSADYKEHDALITGNALIRFLKRYGKSL